MNQPTNIRTGAFAVLGAALMLACTLAQPAHAAIVYNNGGPNFEEGREMTQWNQADDFSFGASTTFDTVRFWNLQDSKVKGTFTGSFTWGVYSNNVNTPGTLLYSGSSAPTTRTSTGRKFDNFLDEYENIFTVTSDPNTPKPISLDAGTYWLSIHNGPLTTTTRNDFYWESTAPNATNVGRQNDLTDGSEGGFNQSAEQQNAFELSQSSAVATPEPETWAMMGIGLLAVGALGWKRRKQGAQVAPTMFEPAA